MWLAERVWSSFRSKPTETCPTIPIDALEELYARHAVTKRFHDVGRRGGKGSAPCTNNGIGSGSSDEVPRHDG